MKTTKKIRIFSVILAGIAATGALWAQNSTFLSAKADTAGTVKLTGYIIDEDCFVKAGYSDPGKESRGCLLMESCASSGYGLAVLQSDGTYKFYYFDGTFAPIPKTSFSSDSGMSGMDMTDSSSAPSSAATGGQALAANFITDKVEKSNIPVTVSGSLTDSKATNPNPKTADGVYYQLFKADSIEAASAIAPFKASLTGYLSDAVTFLNAQQNKTDPTQESKDTLLSSAAASSGYGVVVKPGSTYRFYYLDGELAPAATGGQAKAAELLSATAQSSHIAVTLSGSFEGHYDIYTDAQAAKHANPVVTVQSLAQTSAVSSSSVSASSSAPSAVSSNTAESVANPKTGTDEGGSPLILLSIALLIAATIAASLAVVKKAHREQ
jgi:hypothetical protein